MTDPTPEPLTAEEIEVIRKNIQTWKRWDSLEARLLVTSDAQGALLVRAVALLSEWTTLVGDTEPRDANTTRLIQDIRAALDAARDRPGLDVAMQSAFWTMAASARIPVERRQEFVDMGKRLMLAELAAGEGR